MADLQIKYISQPCATKKISREEFIYRTGINPLRLEELMDLDWLHFEYLGEDNYLFLETEVVKVQKLLRLCRDLEIPTLAGMIIVDLLERIEALETKLRQLTF